MSLTRINEDVINFVCTIIVCRRRIVKSSNVLKQVYEGNFFLRCYFKLVKILSNNKILCGNMPENRSSKLFFYFRGKRFSRKPLFVLA